MSMSNQDENKLDKLAESISNSWMPDPARMARPEVQSAIEKAQSLLGYPGRMVSGSKSGFSRIYPAHVPVFNGNLCTKSLGKIWYGDLDITMDEDKIKELSKILNEPIYVLYERDARFNHENNPQFDQAPFVISETETICSDEYYERAKRGKNAKKLVYKKEMRRS